MPEHEPAIPEDNEPEPTTRRKLSKAEAELRVIALKRPVSQEALARRWGITAAAVSQWLSEWEARGLVTRVRRGRCKLVQPVRRRLRVVQAA